MTGFTYRSYSFREKDPVIDKMRTLISDEGLKDSQVQVLSGVSATTLHNWFHGETRRPQHSTVMAVAKALGYEAVFQKEKSINYERELPKAQKWWHDHHPKKNGANGHSARKRRG